MLKIVEERDLGSPVPENLKTWRPDIIIARLTCEKMVREIGRLGVLTVDLSAQRAKRGTFRVSPRTRKRWSAGPSSTFWSRGFKQFAYVGFPNVLFSDLRFERFAALPGGARLWSEPVQALAPAAMLPKARDLDMLLYVSPSGACETAVNNRSTPAGTAIANRLPSFFRASGNRGLVLFLPLLRDSSPGRQNGARRRVCLENLAQFSLSRLVSVTCDSDQSTTHEVGRRHREAIEAAASRPADAFLEKTRRVRSACLQVLLRRLLAMEADEVMERPRRLRQVVCADEVGLGFFDPTAGFSLHRAPFHVSLSAAGSCCPRPNAAGAW